MGEGDAPFDKGNNGTDIVVVGASVDKTGFKLSITQRMVEGRKV